VDFTTAAFADLIVCSAKATATVQAFLVELASA